MSKDRELTCIVCPNGCRLKVIFDEKVVIKVDGALCSKGNEYAKSEITNPIRNLTTTIRVEGGEFPLVSVRSDKPIPRDKLKEGMEILKKVIVKAPIDIHQVIVKDIMGTGANIASTKKINCK